MMQKYMVFPIPVGFIEVEASSVKAAVNKYRKAMPDNNIMVIISLTPTQKEILNEIYFGLDIDEAINTSINETIEAYRKMCVVK